MNKHDEYREQVALLLRIMPHIYDIEQFAVHGGTAINLFVKNMPRYSVDIDLTYLPLADRTTSLNDINRLLAKLRQTLLQRIPGMRIIHKPDVWKLLCTLNTAMVKIEVNGTKRGVLEEVEIHPLCPAAEEDFKTSCDARIVSFSQLYGGKLSAALSRQHPRDLFDFKHMNCPFDAVRDGLLLALAGSDKPIVESLLPNPIDQHDALEKQFFGMSEETFSYDEYEQVRKELQQYILDGLTNEDRNFLISFEQGEPDWTLCHAGDLSRFPSVQWKLLNLTKLKKQNPTKLYAEVEKLKQVLLSFV
ncbi:MAG: nucleotidyl transferase AbiEii/AbiGii toxin family protein [Paludibacteraceae bacterium]|nr:nucleotidyl transferase AbiEii/AbiGii toxin family protein [Paludibacteraceae bacterium]